MNKKAVVAGGVLLAGVGLLLLATRKANAQTAGDGSGFYFNSQSGYGDQSVPYYLNRDSGIWTNSTGSKYIPAAPYSEPTLNWGNRLDNIFGIFQDGNLPFLDSYSRPDDPLRDRLAPYGSYSDERLSLSDYGTKPSFFDYAGGAVDGAYQLASAAGNAIISGVKLDRWEKNNSPGNLKMVRQPNGSYTQAAFDGVIPVSENTDQPTGVNQDRFSQFINPWYGIRAAAMVVKNYQAKHGAKTIRQIVTRYAPAFENDTEDYIDFVSRKVGVSPDADFDIVGNLPNLRNLMRWKFVREGSGDYLTKGGQWGSECFMDAVRAAVDLHPAPEQWRGRYYPRAPIAAVFPVYNVDNVA